DYWQCTLPVILTIAQGIASVVAHLHTRGIMHGDLYAHNILVNKQGESILGDFGAASFYNLDDEVTGEALQRLESRAFGCLLEDLLDRHISDSISGNTETELNALEHLRQLQQRCLSPVPDHRPLFSTICQHLTEVSTLV
ncbi:MAG: protein kinase, partial [Cyanobacteria bacterium J06636_28]